jgi:hypothetical protein
MRAIVDDFDQCKLIIFSSYRVILVSIYQVYQLVGELCQSVHQREYRCNFYVTHQLNHLPRSR